MDYFRLPENDTPWNIRLFICIMIMATLNTVLDIALLASLGGGSGRI